MTSRKRNFFYWLFKISSIIISCAFPIWAIYERYPIWITEHGASRSIGAGGILIIAVVLIIFRRTIFDFLRDRFNLKHAPPLFVWLALIAVSYTLMFIGTLLYDVTNILWMGFIGCAIGTLLTFVAENYFRQEKE